MRYRFVLILLMVSCVHSSCFQNRVFGAKTGNFPADISPAGDRQFLRDNGIEPTPDGILEYLSPPTVQQVRQYIQQLGAPQYTVRERALKRLVNLLVVPRNLLKSVIQKSFNREIRWRAQHIIRLDDIARSRKGFSKKSQRILASLRLIRGIEYQKCLPALIQLIPQFEDPNQVQAGTVALKSICDKNAVTSLRKALKSPNAPLKLAVLNALALILKKEVIPEIQFLLKDPSDDVRVATSGILLSLGERKSLIALCELLDSHNRSVRASSIFFLRTATRQRFGYYAFDQSAARGKAVGEWKNWIKKFGATVKLHAFQDYNLYEQSVAGLQIVKTTIIKVAHKNSRVYSIDFSPDGKILASGGGDGQIKLWDSKTGKLLRNCVDQTKKGQTTAHTQTVSCIKFSLDGKFLASSSFGHSIKFWDPKTGRLVRTLDGHKGLVRGIEFSVDGKWLASTSGDKTVRIWDVASGKNTQTLVGHTGGTRCVAFSPDAKSVASSSNEKHIYLWNIATGKCVRKLSKHKGTIRSLVYTPDGRSLISGGLDKSLFLWDVRSGSLRNSFEIVNPKNKGKKKQQPPAIKGIAVSPDNRLAISVGTEDKVRVWHIDTGRQIRAIVGHIGTLTGVAYARSNKLFATSADDSSISIWSVGQLK